MISFWVNEEGSFGIHGYRQNRGREIGDRFWTCLYEDIGEVVRCRGGAQIFSAIDQLTDSQREAAAMVWDAHTQAAPDAPRLNDPRRVLLRFDLLRTLHDRGLNNFRVFRPTELHALRRFPVFVRARNDHNGPLTQLLGTRREVLSALCALRLRGRRLGDLMIVEFCDTSRTDGIFRKYSAFKIGGSILACHVLASREWQVKSEHSEVTDAGIREGMSYVEDNPHESWLRQVFEIAGVDYGRVDYGVVDGAPQLWEINLNPTIGRGTWRARYESLPPDLKQLRERAREAFHSRLRASFVALDRGDDGPEVGVAIDPTLLSRLRADAAENQRRRESLHRLRTLYDSRVLGPPVRAVYSKLFPRR
ncbi:MAG: hypothetical protein ACRD2A_04830 [Vicinamibacterales bacterium]